MLYLRRADITYLFTLFILIVCTQRELMTVEITQFYNVIKIIKKLTFFLSFFRIGNKERHFERELFCFLLLLDSYTSDENVLLVQACTQYFLKENLFKKPFYAKN